MEDIVLVLAIDLDKGLVLDLEEDIVDLGSGEDTVLAIVLVEGEGTADLGVDFGLVEEDIAGPEDQDIEDTAEDFHKEVGFD